MEASVVKSQQVGKYVISILNRIDPERYPNFPYMVELKQLTPKAKYLPSKVHWRYVFKTINEAEAKASDTYNNISANLNHREQERNKRKEADAATKAVDHYKVGDILVNSWGYEQTNIDFFQVVMVNNRTIKIIEIMQAVEENSYQSHGMACNVKPLPGRFVDNGKEYTLRVKAGGSLSQPKSYYYIYKWDGRSMYKSWYA